jgi:hypothetical protein
MAATVLKAQTRAVTAADVAATVSGLPSPAWVAIQVTATALNGTITFEATVDGTTWRALELYPSDDLTATALTSTATAAALFVSSVPLAVSAVRARCSVFTSATAAFMHVRVACV